MKKAQGCICTRLYIQVCFYAPTALHTVRAIHALFLSSICFKVFYEWVSTERFELLTFPEFLSLQFKHMIFHMHPLPSMSIL